MFFEGKMFGHGFCAKLGQIASLPGLFFTLVFFTGLDFPAGFFCVSFAACLVFVFFFFSGFGVSTFSFSPSSALCSPSDSAGSLFFPKANWFGGISSGSFSEAPFVVAGLFLGGMALVQLVGEPVSK